MQEMQETQIQSLDCKDPLEEEMATHSSVLTWKKSYDSRAWQATAQRAAKSQTQLTNWAPFPV